MAAAPPCILVLLFSILSHCGESFTDSNQVYKLQWPGSHPELTDPDHLVMTTRNREKYSCKYKASLGDTTDEDEGDGEVEDTDPVHLLEPLSHVCTQLLDVYWHYEFCYKRTLRQFHEEKLANQEVKVTQYILGKFSDSSQMSVESDDTKLKLWFYNGINYPYYEVTIEGGDVCDLTGQPRKSHLRFICHKEAIFEFVHISEMSSCEYLAVFATQYLCRNPLYRIEEAPVQSIVCRPLEGSPEKPAMLRKIEEEVNERSKALSKPDASSSGAPSSSHVSVGLKKMKPPKPDDNFIKTFLSGSKCLSGGQGWWKQEVCYGRHVKQFHVHPGGQTDILLGVWDRHIHELWYKKNKDKLDQQRKKGVIVHYYAKGDKCDVTGKHRDVQVRIKCAQSVSLSMSLQEPSTCKYLLTVESSYFCSLISSADEYGLFVYDTEE